MRLLLSFGGTSLYLLFAVVVQRAINVLYVVDAKVIEHPVDDGTVGAFVQPQFGTVFLKFADGCTSSWPACRTPLFASSRRRQ